MKTMALRKYGELVTGWMASGLSVAIDSTILVRHVAVGLERLKKGDVLGRVVVDVAGGHYRFAEKKGTGLTPTRVFCRLAAIASRLL